MTPSVNPRQRLAPNPRTPTIPLSSGKAPQEAGEPPHAPRYVDSEVRLGI